MNTRYVPDERGVWRRPGFAGISYSDGNEVEERLLGIISNAGRVDTFAPELSHAITDWPSEYHLSRARHCLLRPLGIRPGDRVLELGCGCGALTRYLGETGAEVVAVDGSAARAGIAAARCRDLSGVRVFCENLLDFETEARFDWVILVGVVEYAPLFSTDALPVEHYVRTVARFLAPAGQLVVAIENQLGLKYFNGCAEDHVGIPFFGVENLYGPRSPVTYGRRELARRIQSCGFAALEWFYPFPDYKLPTVVVSSRAFEAPGFGVADLLARAQSRDYGGNQMRLFEEALALSALHQNGLLEELSNSFMLVARHGAACPRPSKAIAWTYAVHRHERFTTQTAFIHESEQILVEKTLLVAPSQEHISPGEQSPIQHTPKSAVYSPGRLSIWRILDANARNASVEEMANAFLPWFDELLRRSTTAPACEAGTIATLGRLADYEIDGGMIDCTPFNLIEHELGLSVIDQEWQWSGKIPLGQVVCRSVLHSLTLPLTRSMAYDLADVVKHLCARRQLSAEGEEITIWLRRELEFLAAVGAPVPDVSALATCRSHLLAVYPELVRRVQEVSFLQAELTRVQAEQEAQRAVLDSQIAQSAVTQAALEARLREHSDQIGAMQQVCDSQIAQSAATQAALDASLRERSEQITAIQQVCDSQAGMIAGLTRDLADQAVATEVPAAPPRHVEDQQLARELAAARDLVDHACHQRDSACETIAALEETHRRLITSTSWRITSPLRALKTEAQQLAGRLRRAPGRRWKSAPDADIHTTAGGQEGDSAVHRQFGG